MFLVVASRARILCMGATSEPRATQLAAEAQVLVIIV